MSLGDRVEAMLQRTADAAASLPAEERDRLARALRAAMTHRRKSLPQEDPRTLHPARTVLILAEDLNNLSIDSLLAGALAESADDALRVDPETRAVLAGARGMELLQDIPDWNDDALLERLVTADDATVDIALAERLDHLRHLHLRPEAEWRAPYETARDAYLPMARRRGGILARRYEWWCSMFGERYYLPRE